MSFAPADIAQVVHEVNRAMQRLNGEPTIDVPWEEATPERKESLTAAVEVVDFSGSFADQHDAWRRQRTSEGWVYGPVRDNAAKIHPLLVPYDELPRMQRAKDRLFRAVVEALRAA